jgi:hypothetical protein
MRASRCRGAIGLAMIDTVIYTRSAVHGVAIMDSLQAGDIGTAEFVSIPLESRILNLNLGGLNEAAIAA